MSTDGDPAVQPSLVEALRRKANHLGTELDEIDDRIAELESEIARIDDLEAALEEVKQAGGGRSDRIERILQHAARIQRDEEDVGMDYSQVMAAADVTAPTAYGYMDSIADRYDFVQKHKTAAGKTRIVFGGVRLRGLKRDE